MSALRKMLRVKFTCLFLPGFGALAMLCLVITHANAIAGPHELNQPNPVVEQVIVEPSVWTGQPGWLSVNVRNTGTITACGVYITEDVCSSLILEVFLNPMTVPSSSEHYSDCFGIVPPLPPGSAATAAFSFTLDPDLPPVGYCPAMVVREIWLSLEGSAFARITPGHDLFLPVTLSALDNAHR